MKKNLLLMLALSGVCSAQTTITKAFNDPLVGDIANNFVVNGTVDNSATGANTTFNNASLTQGAASQVTYIAPTSSEVTTYPGSTIKMVDTGNSVLYKATATQLEITGVITSAATLNFAADNGTFITYPASLGYSNTDTAKGTFTSTAASGLFKGTIVTTGDASGTLIVGPKTYTNVLRIKSVQNFNLYQSSDVNYLIPIGSVVNTAYTYFDSTHKFPLLSSTSGTISVPLLSINQSTSGAQVINEVFLGVKDTVSKKQNFKIYPNPAQDFIEFTGDSKNYSTAKIYSLDGKLIKTSDINSGKIQISELPSAAYFIEVSGKNAPTETTKLIKK
ncbi:T9SS type A sorting domain-containing protein [Chryseobacterium sp. RG1]|uniref:T9SS type A sorting domain-containing protein n=1 Tax=Chryseobacterium tagetis TaxID=2801334 RepID=A0ABS8A637_9FLAO|nr:T9SS type A sorting domain-containing protein [Chryseobacterium tagetis]MCA6069441.1 T9SS type A sorting domain-containing protein [Chryseobacterium tagetis]